jgi:transposase
MASETKIEFIGGAGLVLHVLETLNLRKLINDHFKLHKNWTGIDKGFIVCVWLSYIISRCDHRLSCLEDWVREHELSLSTQLGQRIDIKDFTDDRLGKILDDFSDSDRWRPFEISVNKHLLRVYDITGRSIQLDATIGQSFGKVVSDGLLQYGYSKQLRADLPQFKTMLANLGDENIPLASITVSGEQSDDKLYIPIIDLAKKSLSGNGLLWQGDKKMSALATRAHIVGLEDYYLSPLSEVQIPKSVLISDYLVDYLAGNQTLEVVTRKEKEIAKGFQTSVQQEYEGKKWTERRLVVRSEQYAAAEEKTLNAKLAKAVKAIEGLNERVQGKKVFKDEKTLKLHIQNILKNNKTTDLIDLDYDFTYTTKQTRASKTKEARTEIKFSYKITCRINEEALKTRIMTLGWQIYATNMPIALLSLEEAVLLYREEYKIEHRFYNLKEEVTRLLPVFLKKENRIVGLIHLLMLALKIIATMEYTIKKKLEENKEPLAGLYAGNPKITTENPTISKIMHAMSSIAIAYIINDGKIVHCFINKLKPIQIKIMDLLNMDLQYFEKIKAIVDN